jgi:formate dehydrogenase accessory protein FdhD
MVLYNTMKTKDEKIPSFTAMTAIILAGGKSSRMGSYKNKSMLRLNGKYLIDIVKSKLECVVGDNIILVGPPMIISRAAPTDWAVELAQKIGISLVGFVRGRRMNIYTHPQQIEA